MLVKFEVVTRTKIKLRISDLSQRAVDSPLNLANANRSMRLRKSEKSDLRITDTTPNALVQAHEKSAHD